MTDSSYWKSRCELRYYKAVTSYIEHLSGDALLDVGGNDTPMALAGEFTRRLVINKAEVRERVAGLEYHIGDFLAWKPEPFDVVLCLQVLEHLADDIVTLFAQKLFAVATRGVVISVPYRWARGACKYHRQDPVDETKLRIWTGRDPTESQVVTDRTMQRLVCWYGLTENPP